MKLTCWGAAEQVSGSMHLLELKSGKKILIDCGFSYENKSHFVEENSFFPFDIFSINAVILTHAHVDHSGNLPNLVKQGYTGPIYCTQATAELTRFLLFDSLNIQQSDKRKKGKKSKWNKPNQTDLYLAVHIERCLEQMKYINFNEVKDIFNNTEIEFFESGHILGAASVKISEISENNSTSIGFTGDLGNYNSKLVVDAKPMNGIDYLVSESTYGGRLHSDVQNADEVLLAHVKNTCVKYNGKLIIPAFSVGRTQAIIFTLNQLFKKGELPNIPVYTDSPLAIRTTKLYEKYLNLLNNEAQLYHSQFGDLFAFPYLHVLENEKESESVSRYPAPAVIVSAAGMVEGGRIQQHIRNNVSDPFSEVLIAGFCAEGTVGYELLQGRPTITINKKQKQVYCKISKTDAFSAHPDQNGLIKYLNESNFKSLKKVFLVHGDVKQMLELKEKLNFDNVNIAMKGMTYELI